VFFLWQGYVSPNGERREPMLERKRSQYHNFVDQYYSTRHQDIHRDTYRQVAAVFSVPLSLITISSCFLVLWSTTRARSDFANRPEAVCGRMCRRISPTPAIGCDETAPESDLNCVRWGAVKLSSLTQWLTETRQPIVLFVEFRLDFRNIWPIFGFDELRLKSRRSSYFTAV